MISACLAAIGGNLHWYGVEDAKVFKDRNGGRGDQSKVLGKNLGWCGRVGMTECSIITSQQREEDWNKSKFFPGYGCIEGKHHLNKLQHHQRDMVEQIYTLTMNSCNCSGRNFWYLQGEVVWPDMARMMLSSSEQF
ncbi:hypothetical protein Ancab_008609 [Ancistrocladus abbreviatus]